MLMNNGACLRKTGNTYIWRQRPIQSSLFKATFSIVSELVCSDSLRPMQVNIEIVCILEDRFVSTH